MDDVSRANLVEEIKNRAKGCITVKNYPEAVRLYAKAIEVNPSADTEGLSILYANRSMCQLGLNEASEALADADASLAKNASYVKGHFRKALALISLK